MTSKVKTNKSITTKFNDRDEYDFNLECEDDLFDDFDELNTKKLETAKFRNRSDSSSSDGSNPASEPKNSTKSKPPAKNMSKSMISQQPLKSVKIAAKDDSKLLIKKSKTKATPTRLDETVENNLDETEPFSRKMESETIRESLSFADKLREMRDENGRLRKLLSEKDYEINQLKKRVNEEKEMIGSLSADAAATRIVDLAKKVRELTAQLESEKSKNKQLSRNCGELESRLSKMEKERPGVGFSSNKTAKEANDDQDDDSYQNDQEKLVKQNKELKEKLTQTSQKMMEYKSQMEILKQDLKKAHKALEKEVGENFDVKTLLSGQSNWRGRQQQIASLQNKVTELKNQIGGLLEDRSQMIGLDDDDYLDSTLNKDGLKSAQFSTMSAISSSTRGDDRHRNDIRKIEKEKREKSQKLMREIEAIEGDYSSLKEKFEAMKARNTVLTNEVKTSKEQIKTLLEKAKHDDELVEALLSKQSQLKEAVDRLQSQNDKYAKEVAEKSMELQTKTMQDKNTIDQLKAILADREKKCKNLEQELNRTKDSAPSPTKGLLKDGGELMSAFTLHPKEPAASEPEAVKFRPPSSTMSNYKPNSIETIDAGSSRSSMRGPKSSGGLNAHEIEMRKEQNVDMKLENKELKILNKSSEVERLRLMELVKTLQKRVEELVDKTVSSDNQYSEVRRRCAYLEKQLEKSKLGDSSKSAAGSSSKAKASNSLSTDQYKMEELETSLLIQKDENDALKAALKSTLDAKEEDLRLYVEMLESTKRVFLDGLKQYKQTIQTSKDAN